MSDYLIAHLHRALTFFQVVPLRYFFSLHYAKVAITVKIKLPKFSNVILIHSNFAYLMNP